MKSAEETGAMLAAASLLTHMSSLREGGIADTTVEIGLISIAILLAEQRINSGQQTELDRMTGVAQSITDRLLKQMAAVDAAFKKPDAS